ncbi:hypothetical protein JHK86_039837 [Glycine max]|nr:hypothetical protein JHK86_039837 [Glycine max]
MKERIREAQRVFKGYIDSNPSELNTKVYSTPILVMLSRCQGYQAGLRDLLRLKDAILTIGMFTTRYLCHLDLSNDPCLHLAVYQAVTSHPPSLMQPLHVVTGCKERLHKAVREEVHKAKENLE